METHGRGSESRQSYPALFPRWPLKRGYTRFPRIAVPWHASSLGDDEEKPEKEHFLENASRFGITFSSIEPEEPRLWVCPYTFTSHLGTSVRVVWNSLPIDVREIRAAWLLICTHSSVNIMIDGARMIRSPGPHRNYSWCAYPLQDLFPREGQCATLTVRVPSVPIWPRGVTTREWQLALTALPNRMDRRFTRLEWLTEEEGSSERLLKKGDNQAEV